MFKFLNLREILRVVVFTHLGHPLLQLEVLPFKVFLHFQVSLFVLRNHITLLPELLVLLLQPLLAFEVIFLKLLKFLATMTVLCLQLSNLPFKSLDLIAIG